MYIGMRQSKRTITVYQCSTQEDPANDDMFFRTRRDAEKFQADVRRDGGTPTDISRYEIRMDKAGIIWALINLPNR
jgi:hypothetical protein